VLFSMLTHLRLLIGANAQRPGSLGISEALAAEPGAKQRVATA
jgi:hypothetical protein